MAKTVDEQTKFIKLRAKGNSFDTDAICESIQRRLERQQDPLNNPDPEPLLIQNLVKHLDHAKEEVMAVRYFEIPTEAVIATGRKS